MKTRYKSYKAEDFLNDDFFIHSTQNPTEESIDFWESLIQNEEILIKEFEFARYYLHKVAVDKGLLSDTEQQQLYKKIETDINKYVRKKRMRFFYPVAAVSILFIFTISTYLFLTPQASQDKLLSIAETLNHFEAQEYVELFLSENERISITENEAAIDYSREGNIEINKQAIEQKTTVENNLTDAVEIRYNKLSVPYGKQSTLILEDGTKIWVNAGTQVIYPVTFESDKREIYVNGEIYLEVSKEQERPFFVKTADMQIEVLGTSFNVSAYQADAVKSVVLVEGSVQVKPFDSRKAHPLLPDEMFMKENEAIEIKQVKALNYISWIDGIYISDFERLDSILLRLSRYYNVKLTADDEAAQLLCSGKLDLKENVINVLDILVATAPVDYRKGEDGEYFFMFNPDK